MTEINPILNDDASNDISAIPPAVVALPSNHAESTPESNQSVSSIEKSSKEHQQDPAVIALMPPMMTMTDMTLFLQTNSVMAELQRSMLQVSSI